MSTFWSYLELGIWHIADLDAFDHLLFIIALTATYQINQLKQILILITSFTIGHSITLGLATFNILTFDPELIEFLIPTTIFITAMVNIIRGKTSNGSRAILLYALAGIFGFIHGMGFSNYLRALLERDGDIFLPLLAFNLGIELGQIGIVIVIMLLSVLLFQFFRFKHRDWILVLSAGCAGAALILMKQTAFW